jgi:hypothetical protein
MTLPTTETRVFYSYEIKIKNNVVGTLQEFSPSARKTVERVREISYKQGTQVMEIVPGVVDFSVTVSKLMLYKDKLTEVLGGKGIFSIEDIAEPFDIYEYCHKPGGETETIVYHGCQIESYDYTVSVRETLITERATIQVAYVTKGG